jgi:hypothetical protein
MHTDRKSKCKNECIEMFLFEKIEMFDKLNKKMSIVVIGDKYGL